MKQIKNLTGTQRELLNITGKEILAMDKEFQRLQKAGIDRVHMMKIELGISEKDAHLWQLDSITGQRFIGPDLPKPKETISNGKNKPGNKEKKEELKVEEKKEKIPSNKNN